MVCSRCKKRPAVIFVTKIENNETVNEGLCIKCAKELNIKPISQMLDQMGITDEELDDMCDQMSGMMGGDGIDSLSSDSFEEGGAQAMNLYQKLMSGLTAMQRPTAENNAAAQDPAEPKKEGDQAKKKKEKKPPEEPKKK